MRRDIVCWKQVNKQHWINLARDYPRSCQFLSLVSCEPFAGATLAAEYFQRFKHWPQNTSSDLYFNHTGQHSLPLTPQSPLHSRSLSIPGTPPPPISPSLKFQCHDAPSLPFQGDQAVNAHATRAPAPLLLSRGVWSHSWRSTRGSFTHPRISTAFAHTASFSTTRRINGILHSQLLREPRPPIFRLRAFMDIYRLK